MRYTIVYFDPQPLCLQMSDHQQQPELSVPMLPGWETLKKYGA